MDTISHREMRNNSAAVLRRVAGGETLVVTNGGVPVAVMSPPGPPTPREKLIGSGELRPARTHLNLSRLPARAVTQGTSAATLDELRGDR